MNARLLGIYEGNGHLSIANYYDHCCSELPRVLPDWQISAAKPGAARWENIAALTPRRRAFIDNYISWPARLRSFKSDIFHIVDQSIAWYRYFLSHGRVIVTVHDLINIMMMRGRLELGDIPTLRRWKMRVCMRQLRKADALVCVSANTADCVRRELDVAGERVHVVHNIVAPEFQPASLEERRKLRGELFGNVEYVMLHVGKPSHYKNRTGVMEVFKRVRKHIPDCRLAITGAPLTQAERTILEERSLVESVSVHLPRERRHVRDLFCAADVLVFPSLYEGFGWPPIEAMASGCPVVSSSAGSLAEVIGEGGVTIGNPRNYAAFADAIRCIFQHSEAREELITRGTKNAERFAKERIFPQLGNIYRTLAA